MDCSYRVYFIQSKLYIQLTIFIVSRLLLGKKKVTNSPVLTMSRKCEKLHLRFPWKAVCEPFNSISTARPEVLAIWLMKFKLKHWKFFQRWKTVRLKTNVDRQIKKQINTQVKLHFEKTNSNNKIFSQKSHFNWQLHLSRQFHVQLRPFFFFLLEFNIFSDRKSLISIWK